MKVKLIIYWVATGLLSAQMLFSAYMYFTNNDYVNGAFQTFGYPSYLIYPLAILKLLGIVAILSKISVALKEAAYVGYLFNFSMAFTAHITAGDGQHMGAVIALILLMISYAFDKMIYGSLYQRKKSI